MNQSPAANYSTGDYYHYTYDALGNRLTQTSQLAVTSYQYDNVNRLTSVNGVNYTWDNNGNLLNDGVNTYAYDSANRLTSISGGQTATFAYNGLGDRLTQNGVGYTLDLNIGLTQVLADGTNTYLYGVGRIARGNTTTVTDNRCAGLHAPVDHPSRKTKSPILHSSNPPILFSPTQP